MEDKMTIALIGDITADICRSGIASVSFGDLPIWVPRFRGTKQDQILQFFTKFPKNFRVTKKRGKPDRVFVYTELQLCDSHWRKDGCFDKSCNKLHVCRYFVYRNLCLYSKREEDCPFSHDLGGDHNYNVLRRFNLDHPGLGWQEIVHILKQSRNPSTLPVLCSYYQNANGCSKGSECIYLHLCRQFIAGNCDQKKCNLSHEMTKFNINVLKKDGIDDIRNIEELKSIIGSQYSVEQKRGKIPSSSDAACKFYQTNSCKFGEKCKFVHICQAFLDGGCNDSKCPRFHSQNSQDSKNSQDSQNSQDLAVKKPRTASSKGNPPKKLPSSDSADSDKRSNKDCSEMLEICPYFLTGQCAYKDKCWKVHSDLPYSWQIRQNELWVTLDEDTQVMIERKFCKPDTSYFKNKSDQKISFRDMTISFTDGDRSDVRRISTKSCKDASVTEKYAFPTSWHWFWKSDDGIFMMFDSDLEDVLESIFLDDPSISVKCTINKHKYIVDFANMQQQNINYKTKREIRRRPEYVDKEIMKQARKTFHSKNETSTPAHWDKCDPNQTYTKIKVSKGPEFTKVKNIFKKSGFMSDRTLLSVTRIQNEDLWSGYSLMKKRMSKRNNQEPAEYDLFHGTKEINHHAIFSQGFDFRLAGTSVGTIFGQGSYFGCNAQVSSRYVDSKKLILAKVLVGKSTKGDSSYKRPPVIPGTDVTYDSCVDDIENPSMFVIFKHDQAYPEYLIEYK